MGRRHFNFAPGVRAMQESIAGAAHIHSGKRLVHPRAPFNAQGVTLKDEPEPVSTARRMFPTREEASAAGATRVDSVGRRRCDSPAIQEPTLGGKRLYGTGAHDPGEVAYPDRALDTPCARRHVPAPGGHLAGTAPQVVTEQPVHVGRRHTRPASTGTARGGLPPQRRHLTREDHMWGASVSNDGAEAGRCSAFNPRGNRSPGMAMAMQQQMVSHDARDSEHVRARRRLEVGDNLFGASVRPSTPPPSSRPPRAESAPRCRRPVGPDDHMKGGMVRFSEAAAAPRYALCKPAPEDNLVGGRFRHEPAAIHQAPAPPIVPCPAAGQPAPMKDANLFNILQYSCHQDPVASSSA